MDDHLLIHASFRHLKKLVPGSVPEDWIRALKSSVGRKGSLIVPAFSYNYKKTKGRQEVFSRPRTGSAVGSFSEAFRLSPGTLRTSSPTHSFCLWGKITESIDFSNAPVSPLGKGSVLQWLAENENSKILMLGVNFTSFTFGHYLEIMAPVPWADFSPWAHLGVLNAGISENGDVPIKESPGCSKAFVNFGKYLLENGHIFAKNKNYLIPVELVLKEGLSFFRQRPQELLCEPGSCAACDNRWVFYLGM